MTPEVLEELVELLPAEEVVGKDGDVYAYMTPPARLAFANFKEPYKDGKRSACLLFPEGADLSLLREAIDEAGKAKFGAKYAKMEIKLALKDAESDPEKLEKEYDGFKDAQAWMNISNIPDKVDVTFIDGDMQLADADAFYSGCWVRARVSFKGNDYKTNSVTCYFTALQFLGDDKEFKGEGNPGAGFSALPAATKAKGIAGKAKTGADAFV